MRNKDNNFGTVDCDKIFQGLLVSSKSRVRIRNQLATTVESRIGICSYLVQECAVIEEKEPKSRLQSWLEVRDPSGENSGSVVG